MLTEDDKAEMRRLRDGNPEEEGWTYAAIAKQFGVSKQRVMVILNPDMAAKQRAYQQKYNRTPKRAARQREYSLRWKQRQKEMEGK